MRAADLTTGDSSSQRGARWLALVAVVAPVLLLTGRVFVTRENFAFRDIAHYYYPQFAWEDRQWRSGLLPLWNPQDNLGTPVAADPTACLFYPGKILFRLPFEFATRFKLYVVAHLVGASLSAYALARAWQCSRAAAVLAAVSYACGGNVLFLYSNVVYLVGAAWLPLALLAIERLAAGAAWRAIVALAAVLALIVLGGDPQLAYHVVLVGLLRLWFARRTAPPLPCPAPLPTTTVPMTPNPALASRKRLLHLAIATCLACGLASVQIIPSLVASRSAARAAFDAPRSVWEIGSWLQQTSAPEEPEDEAHPERNAPLPLTQDAWPTVIHGLVGPPAEHTHHQQVYEFSVGPWRVVEYFWPNVLGRMFPRYRRWGFAIPAEDRVWTPSIYQGLIPLFLAGVALVGPRDPRRRWLAATAIFSVVGSFGGHGIGWIVREFCAALAIRSPDWLGDPCGGIYWLFVTLLPGYVQFRYPAKLGVIAALAIAGLAAHGFDRIAGRDNVSPVGDSDGDHSRLRRSLQWLSGFVVTSSLVLLGVLLVVRNTGQWSSWLAAVPADEWLGPLDIDGAFHDTALGLATGLVISLIVWWLVRFTSSQTSDRRIGLIRSTWIGLTVVDLLLAQRWMVATAPEDAWQAGQSVAKTIGHDRYARVLEGSDMPPEWITTGADDRIAETVRWDAATLFSKLHLLTDARSIESPVAGETLTYGLLLESARWPQSTEQLPPWPLLRFAPSILDQFDVRWNLVANSDPSNRLADPLGGITARGSEHGGRRLRAAERAWIAHSAVWKDVRNERRGLTAARTLIRQSSRQEVPFGSDPREFALAASHPPPDFYENEQGSRYAASLSESESVHIVDDDAQRVTIDAQLPSPALLVLADRYDPDWRVTVRDTKGRELENCRIVPVNWVCRGVWLPAGSWRVEFLYRPFGVYVGAILSLLSWAVWLGVIWMTWSPRRNDCATVGTP